VSPQREKPTRPSRSAAAKNGSEGVRSAQLPVAVPVVRAVAVRGQERSSLVASGQLELLFSADFAVVGQQQRAAGGAPRAETPGMRGRRMKWPIRTAQGATVTATTALMN
jgi:hypothetical protein